MDGEGPPDRSRDVYEDREWLERMAEATQRAANDLRATDSHYHAKLIRDLDDLGQRVRSKLDGHSE